MQIRSEHVHPRPQLTRTDWVDLAGTWGFTYDDDDRGLAANWYNRSDPYTRTIQVPFPPESLASGIGDPSFHPIVWYRRTFQTPLDSAEKRLLLHCGAIDYRARVWVNGQLIATHEGGQTPFSADITSSLHTQGDQVIIIRAEDAPRDLAQPRGKQDWQAQPHAIWYQRTTGIWQPIWLELVSPTHITQIRWTPDPDRGQLGFTLTTERKPEEHLRLRVQLSIHGTMLVDDVYHMVGAELQRQLTLDSTHMIPREQLLWSPAHPNLIEATLTLLADDAVVDVVQSYAGLRSVGVDNGRFLLNGRPFYLRLILQQGYWPDSHLAAPDDSALRRDVELAKALGFNGVRIHQKVEDPRFLYWCDRLGLLVWGEMANAYVYSPIAAERLVREWLAVLVRDYNHPCIVAWVPLNESWGVPNMVRDAAQLHYVQSLYHLTKALDPTRLTIGNDGWEHLISDIYGIHDYSSDGATLRERYASFEAVERTLREVQPGDFPLLLPGHRHTNEPIMLTECGGISYQSEPGNPWYGYGMAKNPEAFLAKYRELITAILDSSAIVGFCYTQLTDTGQETNGLLTANREPKLDPAIVREITERPSVSIAADLIRHLQKGHSISSSTDTALESVQEPI